jgi:hypothetical protein
MSETFHHRRGSRKALWLGLVFFPLMAIVTYMGALDAPPQNRVWFLLFMGGFWLTMFASNMWCLLATYCESWQLSEDRIVHEGVFRRREIPFSQVTELRWRLWPGHGSIVLRSEIGRIAFGVDTFELEERVALIRSLRAAVPEQSQIGWPMFCQRFAAPLLDRLEANPDRPMQAGEIRITRARYDRALKIGVPAAIAIAIPLAILFKQPAFYFFPVFVTLMWLLLRYKVPKTGAIEKRPSSEPNVIRFLMAISTCGGLMIAASFWIDAQRQLFPNPNVAQGIVVAVGISSILTMAIFADLSKRRQEEAAAPAAVKRWEAAFK